MSLQPPSSLRSPRLCRFLTVIVSFSALFTLHAASDPKLDDFPKASRLWLSNTNLEIQPADSKHYNSPLSGYLKLIAGDGEVVEKGAIWAVMRPDAIELSEQIQRVEELLTQEQIHTMELDHLDQIDTVREKLTEFEQQRSRLAAILNSPQFSNNQSIVANTRTTLKIVDSQIERENRRLQTLLERSELSSEITKIGLESQRKTLDLENNRRNSELRAPFTGTLHLHLELDEETPLPHTVWIENGNPLATLINDKHYEIKLPLQSFNLEEQLQENLIIQINGGSTGKPIRADFHRTGVSVNNGVIKQHTLFRVKEEDGEKAKKSIGTLLVGSIYVQFDEPCHIISKAQLLKETDTEDLDAANWGDLVRRCWPGATVQAVGHLSLAVQPAPKENE